MSEESPTPESGSETPKKKPAPKRTASKAKAATTRKTAARKAPVRKKTPAAENNNTKVTNEDSAASQEAAPEAPPASDAQADAPERENTASSAHAHYGTSKMVEDLKGRDWPKIIQRALLMFFFGVLGWISLSLAFFLAAAQVVFTIFAGEANSALTRIIKQFANYIHDVLDYLSFASDECPFPFGRKFPDAD